RGLGLLMRKRTEEALACFDEVLRLDPRHVARLNRGNALAELGRTEEALAEYDRVITMTPNHPAAQFNRGNALHALGRYAEAVGAFDRALALVPQHGEAWNNRGIALYALNRHPEALASYGRALALRPDHADAHYNRSLSLLITGDYGPGFAEYEWRNRRTGLAVHHRQWPKPLWLGEVPIAGKRIVIHAEQGLGDTIQFVRYAPLLSRAGAKVIVEAQPELVGLLSTVDGVLEIFSREQDLAEFDVHCPLPSLPHALRTGLASLPAEIPYLRSPPERLAKWRERMEQLRKPRVALAWSGNPAHPNDRHRSIPLALLDPLLSTP